MALGETFLNNKVGYRTMGSKNEMRFLEYSIYFRVHINASAAGMTSQISLYKQQK